MSYEQSELFEDAEFPGFDARESFDNDIRRNLVEWATEGNTICYRTTNWWYAFEAEDQIIWMTRVCPKTGESWTTWQNRSTAACGKEFLLTQKEKRIPMRRG